MLARSTPLITALIFVLAPAAATATPLDVASTHAYIQANYAYVRASDAIAAPTQSSILRYNRKLRQECPHVGEGSPQNEESQIPSHEVAGALWSITYGADAGTIRSFVRAVKPLRWSNHKLTGLVARYAKSLQELAVLPLPDLCGDIRAWRASGYKTVPADTISFVQHAEAIEGHPIPARLLAPYELPNDKATVKRTLKTEGKLEEIESVTGFNDWDMLLATLSLQQ